MEITPFMMYWLVKLDSITTLAEIFSVVLGIVSLFLVVFTSISYCIWKSDNDSGAERIFTGLKGVNIIILPLFILSSLCMTFTPTTKQMAAILVVPPIINNERVQEMPNRILDLGIEWLDELRPADTGGTDE